MPMSGKTTIGEFIAKKMNFDFYDTDLVICKNNNHSIKEIIAKNGEDFFRMEESKISNTMRLKILLSSLLVVAQRIN